MYFNRNIEGYWEIFVHRCKYFKFKKHFRVNRATNNYAEVEQATVVLYFPIFYACVSRVLENMIRSLTDL